MSTLAEVRLWGKTIGAVSLQDGEDVASFEYDAGFAQSGIQLAPIVMQLSRRVFRFPELARPTFFGLPGLLAYGVLWLAVAGQTVRAARRLVWPERGVAVGLLAAWAALAVHHLVDKLYVNNIYVHLGAMLALLQLLSAPGLNGERPQITPITQISPTAEP